MPPSRRLRGTAPSLSAVSSTAAGWRSSSLTVKVLMSDIMSAFAEKSSAMGWLRQFPRQRVFASAGTDHQKFHRRGIESGNRALRKRNSRRDKNKLRQRRRSRFTGFLSAPAQFPSEDGLSLQQAVGFQGIDKVF